MVEDGPEEVAATAVRDEEVFKAPPWFPTPSPPLEVEGGLEGTEGVVSPDPEAGTI